MLQSSKEEVLDRTTEAVSAVAEQDLQAEGESVPYCLCREPRSQLRDRRHVAVDHGILASNGQPPT
jgi:hypothetical protein